MKLQLAAALALVAMSTNAAMADISGNWGTSSSTANVQLSAIIPQLIRITVFEAGSPDPSTLSVTGNADGNNGLSMPNLIIKGKVESNLSGITVTMNNGGNIVLKKAPGDATGINYTFPATVNNLNNNSTFSFTGTPTNVNNGTASGTYSGTVTLTAAKI